MAESFEQMLERVKREHPLTGNTEATKPILYRSKLIEYEKRHGRPFPVTGAYEIVEDVPATLSPPPCG